MQIDLVMDDIGAALATIDGLRAHPYYKDSVNAPAAIVGLPETYEFDSTFGRGSDMAVFPVTVVIGRSDAERSRNALAKYLAGAGDSSIKEAVESFTATAYDSARVTTVVIGAVTIAAVSYLAATFDIEIYGSGSGA